MPTRIYLTWTRIYLTWTHLKYVWKSNQLMNQRWKSNQLMNQYVWKSNQLMNRCSIRPTNRPAAPTCCGSCAVQHCDSEPPACCGAAARHK